jgi:hypothetical protein
MLPDMTPDMLGIGLGLGEEIAIAKRAGEMSQGEDGVLGPAVTERGLVPLSKPVSVGNLVDLTNIENWFVPGTKRLRSPFTEKWKRVALGLKEPNAPLLTFEEGVAYSMASDSPQTYETGKELRKIPEKIKQLKKLSLQLKLKAVFKKINERRCSHDKDQNNGKDRI